jgi:hypothetical protein
MRSRTTGPSKTERPYILGSENSTLTGSGRRETSPKPDEEGTHFGPSMRLTTVRKPGGH